MVPQSESITCDKVKSESPLHPPQEESIKDLSFSSLNKQNSLFSLTLDEVQSKSGMSFGSMNIDEFLANVWNAEDQPQQQNLHNAPSQEPSQRRQTFGEMTLEDFLIKAGVVQKASGSSLKNRVLAPSQSLDNFPNNNSCLEANYEIEHAMDLGFSDHQNGSTMFAQSNRCMGESSNNAGNEKCHNALESSELKSKKGKIDGPAEVVVERRQRRMIRNRESAARSRARKQAYTVELEVELDQLREENARLKQVVAEAQRARRQEQQVMRGKPSTKAQKIAEKLRTMRRTISLAW